MTIPPSIWQDFLYTLINEHWMFTQYKWPSTHKAKVTRAADNILRYCFFSGFSF